MRSPCVPVGRLWLLSLLAILVGTPWITRAAESPQPLRILWAGSSSLYYHNAPKVFAQWLTATGRSTVSDLVGRSGTGVHVYLRPEFKAEFGLKSGQTILQRIAQGGYNYVVLQVAWEEFHGAQKRLKEAEEQ